MKAVWIASATFGGAALAFGGWRFAKRMTARKQWLESRVDAPLTWRRKPNGDLGGDTGGSGGSDGFSDFVGDAGGDGGGDGGGGDGGGGGD